MPFPGKAAHKLADDPGLHPTMDGPQVKKTWSTHQRWVLQLASRIGNHANHHDMCNTCRLSNFTNQISGVSTGDLWLVIWEIIWNSQKDGFCMQCCLLCLSGPPRRNKHVTEQVSAEWFAQIAPQHNPWKSVSPVIAFSAEYLQAFFQKYLRCLPCTSWHQAATV